MQSIGCTYITLRQLTVYFCKKDTKQKLFQRFQHINTSVKGVLEVPEVQETFDWIHHTHPVLACPRFTFISPLWSLLTPIHDWSGVNSARTRQEHAILIVRVVRSGLFKSYPNPPREKMNVILLDAIYLVFICCYNDVIATLL